MATKANRTTTKGSGISSKPRGSAPPVEIPKLEVHETPGQPPDSWLGGPEFVIADALAPVLQEDHAADRADTPVSASPPPPIGKPSQPQTVPKAAPRMPLKPPPFATRSRGISLDDLPLQASGREPGFFQASTTFDGLAPPIRETDVFSNFDTVPMNDAAFGGARLSRPDEYIVPETPAIAARRASDPEHDFAEDDFWNRTDEEDGLPPQNTPPVQPAAASSVQPAPPPAPPRRRSGAGPRRPELLAI